MVFLFFSCAESRSQFSMSSSEDDSSGDSDGEGDSSSDDEEYDERDSEFQNFSFKHLSNLAQLTKTVSSSTLHLDWQKQLQQQQQQQPKQQLQ